MAKKKIKKAVKKAAKKTVKNKKPSKPSSKKVKAKKNVKAKPKKVQKQTKKKATAKKASKPKAKILKKKSDTTKVKAAAKPVRAEKEPRKKAKSFMADRDSSMTAEKFVLPPLPEKPKPSYTPMKQMPDVMMIPKSSESSDKKRYNEKELQEFKEIILKKLDDARNELNNLQASLLNANDNGTDDTATTFKMLEDGSDTLAKEEAGQLMVRQRKFVEQLENALVRIENKTYGICRVTGKLIPKERLRAVPHTTQSIEAKMQQYRD